MNGKPAVDSKLMWLGGLVSALGVVETQIHVIPPQYQGFVLLGVGVLIAFLRGYTSQPISGVLK